MKYCQHCGEPIEASARLCEKCGGAQPIPTAAPSKSEDIPQSVDADKSVPIPAEDTPVRPVPVTQVYDEMPAEQPIDTASDGSVPAEEGPAQLPVDAVSPAVSSPEVITDILEDPEPQTNPPSENDSPPRRSKKKLWILIPIVCALLIGALLYYFLCCNTAEGKLLRAYEKTMDALSENFEGAENLTEFFDVLGDLQDKHTLKMNLNLNVPSEDIAFDFSYVSNLDRDAKIFDGTITLDTAIEGTPVNYSIPISANEQELMIRLPEQSGAVYSLPLSTFGKDFVNSPLFDEELFSYLDDPESIQINPFADALTKEDFLSNYEDSYNRFAESIEIGSLGTQKMKIGGVMRDCTAYSVDYNSTYYEQLMKDYFEYFLSGYLSSVLSDNLFSDSDTPFAGMSDVSGIEDLRYYIDDRGYLIALSFYYSNDDSDSYRCAITLDGTENPWNSVRIDLQYGESEESVSLFFGINRTEQGFNISIFDESTTLLAIKFNDAARKISIVTVMYSGEDYTLATISYNTDRDSCGMKLLMNFEPFVQFGLDMTWSPLAATPTMLAEDATSFFEMTESELTELYESIFGAEESD